MAGYSSCLNPPADSRCKPLAQKEFNYFTPGNEGKWGWTNTAQNTWDFYKFDSIVSWAAQNDIKVCVRNRLLGVRVCPSFSLSLCVCTGVYVSVCMYM